MSVAFTDDVDSLRRLLGTALETLADARDQRKGPLPDGGPAAIGPLVADGLGSDLLPERGIGEVSALARVGRTLVAGSADPTHPAAAAHLHCPPLALAVAAETVAAASNQSVDSWDQGPAAIAIERQVVATLSGLVGFDPATSAGVLTTGGSESNLMGLLLARDAARRPRVRVLCSRLAHFSIARSAALLGLGEASVVG
ncbi:MAG TPA: pyridoxal-dependent decarboxylase, partial [Actinopolymorphaceae bacterium]